MVAKDNDEDELDKKEKKQQSCGKSECYVYNKKSNETYSGINGHDEFITKIYERGKSQKYGQDEPLDNYLLSDT